ncbi:hypothetical protein GGR51DRAFT_562482 [Nemania sp. FL0031]|nr:hypothetical protein GGR51DRAFT_562482 [Nemania sp. FL0031]
MADAPKTLPRLPLELIFMIWDYVFDYTPVEWNVYSAHSEIEGPFSLIARRPHYGDYMRRVKMAKSIIKADWASYRYITAKLWIARTLDDVGIKFWVVIPSIDIFIPKKHRSPNPARPFSGCPYIDCWPDSFFAGIRRSNPDHNNPYEVLCSKVKYISVYIKDSDKLLDSLTQGNDGFLALKRLKILYFIPFVGRRSWTDVEFNVLPSSPFEHDPWVKKLLGKPLPNRAYRILGVSFKSFTAENLHRGWDLDLTCAAVKKLGMECVWIEEKGWNVPEKGKATMTYYVLSSTQLVA